MYSVLKPCWNARRFLLLLPILIALAGSSWAQGVALNNIDVRGNQRIDSSTITTFAELEIGEIFTEEDLGEAYRRILESGLFETVEMRVTGGAVEITVTEFPTINRLAFEGNRRIDDEDLASFIESAPRQVFNPSVAERDANTIAEAYAQQGRISTRVQPRIIRRSDNRVDLIFEIAEAGPIEIERVSFLGNRQYSDRRLRRVIQTKQANILRSFLRSDTFVEDRIEFDKQVLRDFYLARGFIDFRVVSTNVELTEERDAFFLAINIQEGQQFRFGDITVISDYTGVDAQPYQKVLRIRPTGIYSPTLVENSIARMERLAVTQGVDFLRVEPRVTRNDRDLTLDLEFVISRGERIFVERIDIRGNSTTLDRVIRQQFRIVEGDPFNPREIRASAERIRALGFFSDAEVEAREGSAPDRVVIEVDVEEQPTGSLSLGGAYSRNDGFGVLIGLEESNFLGRGQRLAFDWSTASDSQVYTVGFTEPQLLGQDVILDLALGYTEEDSDFASFDSTRSYFRPSLTFPLTQRNRLQLRYFYDDSRMVERSFGGSGAVISNEVALGDRVSSGIGYRISYDSRRTGLNPNAGILAQFGQELAGIGGDTEYIKTSGRLLSRTLVFGEEVVLRASVEAGVLTWLGDGVSRTTDRFFLSSARLRGFEPAGVGPRDQSNKNSDALGGNYFSVARFEAEFPLGLPEEIGVRGGAFYDVGNLWDLDKVNTADGEIVGADGALRQVIGVSLLWDTPIGPLRFNFSNAVSKEDYDRDQNFDFTLQTSF
ncbi:MAG: outer membrane protein assembly factor BamA [Aestuariivita sp.]|nr:outer membrane protein assembly factor BamA [Aestuariivita sp.]MCY4345979.1 outer membrane protein assembly factor BamA [Aestuariivita sp.]